MEFSSKHDDAWIAKGIDAAVAGARKSVIFPSSLTNVPVGRLTDPEWGTIVSAVLFSWIEARVQQAIAEGLDQEASVRLTGFSPDPCDIVVVTSILLPLVDAAGIDWSLSLSAWSRDQMINFLMIAWRMLRDAERGILHPEPKAA